MGYFRFFPQTRHFFSPVPYPINKKNPLDYYSFKVKYFHGDSVKNESARTKNPACLGLKSYLVTSPIINYSFFQF